MNQYGLAFLGLTAIVAFLVALLTFAVLRFGVALKQSRGRLRQAAAESALLSTAFQDAVIHLKAQERAMSDRAAASEQLNAQIVESLTAGLVVVDKTGEIEIFNPAGRRMLEIESDPIGGDYRVVLGRAPELVAVIRECLASAQPILRRSIEVTGTTRPSYFGVTVSPLTGSSRPGAAICLFSDLTNVMDLEEQLRLKDTLARLGELTAGIAHEFRNGLATIHGYGRLIDPQALPVQYQPYLEGIRQEADALGKVVTNFLKFARPEQITLAPVDLEQIVRRAADDLQHELPVGTRVTVQGPFGQIQGDEVLLRQVFGNLIRNAVEACEIAGLVPEVIIHGQGNAMSGMCRLSVDDNGPGIPESARDRIFQPFFTTRARGTGLGLAIVQKVVVMHNGRITAGASPTGGASFQLSFASSST
jgi:signal transduction histidine kinase